MWEVVGAGGSKTKSQTQIVQGLIIVGFKDNNTFLTLDQSFKNIRNNATHLYRNDKYSMANRLKLLPVR